MALVDYASDDESQSDPVATDAEKAADAGTARPSQPAKKRKTSHCSEDKKTTVAAPLPPLPSSFHDLYASAVRVSTVDDPTLHQGRKRQIPHVAGNWPTHLYVEWHPTSTQHALLTSLLDSLQARMRSDPSLSSTDTKLSSFLTSDLGAPLPLHISLSRPIVLSTAQKDSFLAQLREAVFSSGISPFVLTPRALEWHRTSESARSFLVLRISAHEEDSEEEKEGNPQLGALLKRCNDTVKAFGQPTLYAFRGKGIDDAFHISIAWSFAEPKAQIRKLSEDVFTAAECRDAVRAMSVIVDGVKAKIGNVVTHVSLPTWFQGPEGFRRKQHCGYTHVFSNGLK